MAATTAAAPNSSGASSHQGGYYCSTSGTVLEDRAALQEHYKSEFHRYNLKRKVAGLPPVTQEWFEARRAQLMSATGGAAAPTAPGQGPLAGSTAAAAGSSNLPPVPQGSVRVWYDPLMRKAFRTEQTYLAHTRSNKYLEAVRRSGQPAPPAIISLKKLQEQDPADASKATGENMAAPKNGQVQASPGYRMVKPSGGLPLRTDEAAAQSQQPMLLPRRQGMEGVDDDEDDEEDGGSGWETASDEDAEDLGAFAAVEQCRQEQQQPQAAGAATRRWGLPAAAAAVAPEGVGQGVDAAQGEGEADGEGAGEVEEWEQWDVRRSLFDNHMSQDLEGNLEYMWLKYGFYLPDAQYLQDPEGLIKYLGSKLQYGRVPIYSRGDDPSVRQFRSLHAVQRHMVDSGRCKLCYEDNEDEYSEFYDYEEEEEGEGEAGQGKELAMAPAVISSSGYELAVPGSGAGATAGAGKMLGHRDFARYYRQRHRNADDRQIVQVNTMLSKYRALGISLKDESVSLEVKKLKSKTRRDLKWEGKRAEGLFMRGNVNKNLPTGCSMLR